MVPWMSIAQLGLGAIQTGVAASKMAGLPERRQYAATPEMEQATAMFRNMAQNGMSMDERAAYENQIARQSNAAYRRSMETAPGSAQATLAAIESARLSSANDLALQNAAIKRSGMGMFSNMASQKQAISDRNVSDQNAYRDRSEQALGQAMQAGIGNMFGAFNSANTQIQNDKTMAMYDKYLNGNNKAAGAMGAGKGALGSIMSILGQ